MRIFVLIVWGTNIQERRIVTPLRSSRSKRLVPVRFRHAPLRIVRGAGADGYLMSLRGKVFAAPGVEGSDSGFVGPIIDAENKYAQCHVPSIRFILATSEFPQSRRRKY